VTLVAGVDVGGTKVEACIADPVTGAVHARERIATRVERGGASVLEDCVLLVGRLCRGVAVAAVGVGICELVDLHGRVRSADAIDWRDLDVGRAFRAVAPVRLESDVRAAALAEARFGAGRRRREPWLYVTVGTGVSFCLVVDGRPYAGAHGHALVVGAPPVERLASGRALERQSKRASATDVLADPACSPIVERGASALGNALAMLANALDPALIVVGGGLGLVDHYRDRAAAIMRPQIEADDARDVPVVAAALGPLAGPLGAAVAAAPVAPDPGAVVPG
jgi:glucokinase